MIKRITPYRWFAALLLSLGLFTVGCGSSGDEFVAQGGGQNTPVGTIVVNQVLLRAVPSAVTQQRFTGFDSSGVVRFGPVTLAKAASIELTGVSTSVTRLQIEYLQGNTVVGLGSVAVTVTANGTTTVDDPPFQDVTAGLNSIEVTPAAPTIAAGTQQAFTAVGNFADGTEVDLTSSVTWTSSSLANATINDNGVATGVAVGSSTITASVGSVSGTATLTISGATLVSLEITPANPPLAQGGTQQLTLTGTFSDDSTQNLAAMATWTSGNPDIATVSDTAPSKGLVTANNISSGTASVQASVLGQSASTTISVTGPTLALLQVYSNSANVPAGFSAQLTAIATYTDQTTATVTEQVNWSSSDTNLLTVSADGVASGVAAGSATATATFASVSAGVDLEVTGATLASLLVTPSNAPQAGVGRTEDFSAFGTFSDASVLDLTEQVAWASANAPVATIDPTTGRATAVAMGVAGITATSGAVVSPTQNFTVTATSTDYTVSRVPFTYEFLQATDSLVIAGDDEAAALPTGQGFDFEFYGTTYTAAQTFVCTNGFVRFGSSSTSTDPHVFPGASTPNQLIAGLFTDLVGAVRARTVGDTPNRRLILQWDTVTYTNGHLAQFQMVLFEGSNEIEIRYLDTRTSLGAANGTDSTGAGVVDGTPTFGTQLGFDQKVLLPSTAFRLSPP